MSCANDPKSDNNRDSCDLLSYYFRLIIYSVFVAHVVSLSWLKYFRLTTADFKSREP